MNDPILVQESLDSLWNDFAEENSADFDTFRKFLATKTGETDFIVALNAFEWLDAAGDGRVDKLEWDTQMAKLIESMNKPKKVIKKKKKKAGKGKKKKKTKKKSVKNKKVLVSKKKPRNRSETIVAPKKK